MGNVGKPNHLPAGKARTSEEWRRTNSNNKVNESERVPKPDPYQAPTGEGGQPILRGGRRPGVESRMEDAVEGNEDLEQAEANFEHRTKENRKPSRDDIAGQ